MVGRALWEAKKKTLDGLLKGMVKAPTAIAKAASGAPPGSM